MLIGIKNGIRINSIILIEEQKKNIRETKIICPVCKEEVILVDGSKVITHFRHKPNSDCKNSGETQEHIKMKVACYKILKEQSNVSFLDLEFKIDNQIADVYFKIGQNVCVIECQCSPISKEEIDSRTKGWEQKGCFVVWIYGKKFYKKTEDGLFKLRKAIRNKYFFYTEEDGLFFKVEIEQYSEERTNEYMGYDYTYYFKTIKKLIFNKIENPTFCHTDYKGYKRVYLK